MIFAADFSSPIDLNSPLSLTAAMMMCVIGPALVMVEPVWVEGLVQHGGYSIAVAQSINAAELSGILLATIIMALVAPRLNWRMVFGCSLLLVVTGNLASLAVVEPTTMMGVRFIIGIASGAIVSLSFMVVGLTANRDRNYGYLMVWVLVYAAIANPIMPMLYSIGGINSALLFLAGFTACGLPFVKYLPVSGEEHHDTAEDAVNLPIFLKVMALAAVLSFFVGIGLIWAFLSLIGTSAGVSEQAVASSIGFSQLFGIAGGATAVVLAARYGRVKPITLGIVGCFLSILFLFGAIPVVIFTAAACLFLYSWNVVHAYLYAAMASFDPTGRVVAYTVPMQMLGFALGPVLGAGLIGEVDYHLINWIAVGFFIAAAALFLPPLLVHARTGKLSTSDF
jgi:MFS family permease